MRFKGLIVAVIFAAIAAIVVMRMMQADTAPTTGATPVAAPVKATKILVAAKAIPIGSALTQDMVAQQDWPEHLALPGFIKAGDENANVVGMVARAPFQQNEPMILSKLANPNDPNFLAGDLPAGMRVVTIPVNEVDGIAGFVFPGDHVDIIYTHDVEKWEVPPTANAQQRVSGVAAQKTKKTITETLLTNVKVLAVDQRSSNVGATDKNGNLVVPKSASLMVSQTDSQRVRLAQKTGTLSLVLRSLADRETSDPMILTDRQDISQDKGSAGFSAEGGENGVKIVRGAPNQNKEIESSIGAAIARGAVVANPAPVVP